ncbi:MAG: lipopolysaccharide biosynthesis protein [Longimicrobiales bacterium]|nr:lipopolysaccharide biosynthesis protein [Longimicrobiales bacterium]
MSDTEGRGPAARSSADTDRRDLARGAGANYLGSVARIAPRALFLVFAGRFYGDAGFGSYTFGITVVETAAALSLFGMKRSLFRFMGEARTRGEPVDRAVANGIALAAGAGLAATLLVGFFATPLAGAFGLPGAAAHLRVLTLALPLIVASDILLIAIRFTRRMRFEVVARSLVEPITLTLALLALRAAGMGDVALSVAYVVSLLAAAVTTGVFFTHLFPTRAILGTRLSLRELRGLVAFSGPTAGYELFLMLADKVDVFLVSYFGTSATVGVYGMARQFATVTKKIRAGFDRILPPVLSESIAADDLGRADQQVTMVARWILTVQLMVVLLFAFFGAGIMGATGAEFAAGALALALLMAADAVNGSVGVGELPFVFLRPWVNVWLGALLFVLTGGLGLLWTPVHGAAGAAGAVLAAAVLANGARIVASRRLLGLALVRANILKPVAAGGLAAATLILLRALLPAWLPLGHGLPGALLVLGAYLAWLRLLGLEDEDRDQLSRITARLRRG